MLISRKGESEADTQATGVFVCVNRDGVTVRYTLLC